MKDADMFFVRCKALPRRFHRVFIAVKAVVSAAVTQLLHDLVRVSATADRTVRVDAFRFDVQRGDRFLLCSDGVHDMLENDEIAALLKAAPDPNAAIARLSAAVRNAGAADNFTMICVFA